MIRVTLVLGADIAGHPGQPLLADRPSIR